jgi:hypothetical protein
VHKEVQNILKEVKSACLDQIPGSNKTEKQLQQLTEVIDLREKQGKVMWKELPGKMLVIRPEITGLVRKKQTTQSNDHIAKDQTLRKATRQKAIVLNRLKDLLPVIHKAKHSKVLLRVVQRQEI